MLPDQAEKISHSKIILTPFSQDYLQQAYVDWLNDPELMKFSEQRHVHHTLDSCQLYFEQMMAQNHFFWAILNHEKQHIGNVTAYIDRVNLRANLAILIGAESCQGKGLGLQAWLQAMNYLFECGLRKVHAGTLSPNIPMRKIFEKSGMTVEGVLKEHHLLNGQPTDVILVAKYSNN